MREKDSMCGLAMRNRVRYGLMVLSEYTARPGMENFRLGIMVNGAPVL